MLVRRHGLAAATVGVVLLSGCLQDQATATAALHASCGDPGEDAGGLVGSDGGSDDLDVSLEFCTVHRQVSEAGLPWLEPVLPGDARDDFELQIESALADFGSGFVFVTGAEDAADLRAYAVTFRLPQPDCDQLVLYLLEVARDDGDMGTIDALQGDPIRRGSTAGEHRIREVLDLTGAEDCERRTLDELVPDLDGLPAGSDLERAPID